MMTAPPDTTSLPSLSMCRASDAPYGDTMVMGEEPAAPVRRIYYTPPLPGLTPMPDMGLPSLLSTRGEGGCRVLHMVLHLRDMDGGTLGRCERRALVPHWGKSGLACAAALTGQRHASHLVYSSVSPSKSET